MTKKASKTLGITESYWTNLNEDKKLKWKIFSRLITMIAALAVTKSGIVILDWCIAVIATFLSIFLIETQRTYTRYSIEFRKTLIRISIALGSWCAVFLGIIYFSQIAILAMASTFSSMPDITTNTKYPELTLSVYLTVFFFASIYGILKVFRDLKIEELIYHIPRSQLKKFLIQRKFKAENFYSFAYFELSVIAIALLYSSGSGVLLEGIIKLTRLGST
jgi:hypothetical protein